MLPPAASSVLRPLQGVTVVALEQAVSAPLCTRHLADMGARVIKIERLGEGDYLRTLDWSMKGMCSHFVWANRGKESVTLDVKKPEGLQIMNQLLEKADVYVQNLAPGATERLGLDAAAVLKRHPSLVCATIAGYGANGPYETKKAYDMLIQAEAGLLDVTGTADTPAKVGTPVADIASAMYAYSGVLAALFRRATQPGKPGADIEVSMLDALGDWMGWIYYYSQHTGKKMGRHGAMHAAIQPYGPFAVGAKQEKIMLAVQSNREWQAFCAFVLKRPDLEAHADYSDQPQRVLNKAKLQAEIESIFRPLTKEQVIERLEEAGIAYSEYRTALDAADHPQWKARNRWGTVKSPVGDLNVLRPVVEIGDTSDLGEVAAVGQHTRAVLANDLGFSQTKIDRLYKQGIV